MADLIKKLPITPLALGGLYWLLSGDGPRSIREPILARFAASLTPAQLQTLIKALKWAFVADAARFGLLSVHRWLNSLAYNNFRGSDRARWDWQNEIALVTGGASGLGLGIAQKLAGHGVRVVTLDVNEAPSSVTDNPRITHFVCDITDYEALQTVANTVRKDIGHPSILINNAGIAFSKSILHIPPADLHRMMNVNLISHWWTVKEFLPNMIKERKGHVLTMASMASFATAPGMVPYSVTKSGAQVFHEGLAAELRSIHHAPEILLTIVHPTWTSTPLIARYEQHIRATGSAIIKPEVVIRATVDQILSCKGGRLILSPEALVVENMRVIPAYLSYLITKLVVGKDVAATLDDKKTA